MRRARPEHTISADQTTARSLVDTVEGRDAVELSRVSRGDVRFFVFTVRGCDEGPLEDLSLPAETRVLFAYRDDEPLFAADELELREKDDVILLTRSKYLNDLRERWKPDSD